MCRHSCEIADGHLTTDPSFYLPQTPSPFPQRPMLSGPGGCRPPGKLQTSSHPPPPRKLASTPANRRDESHWRYALAGYLLAKVLVSPGDVHFSQDHLFPPPVVHPIALKWSDWVERAGAFHDRSTSETPILHRPFLILLKTCPRDFLGL